jgi:hypothetical protein
MERLSDSHHFRKMVAGTCMMLAPLLFLVGVIVLPELKTDEAAQLAVVRDDTDAFFVAQVFMLASLVLFVPALLGLMHMLREREAAFGHIGGGLALLGTLSAVGGTAIGFVVWQMASGNPDQMTALLTRLNETAGVWIPFLVLNFGISLGLIVLAYGLLRARAVAPWMAAVVAIGGVCSVLSFPIAANWLAIVGAAFLFVGFGSIGRMVMRESDADWEHTPEYSGFRALPGMR